MYADAQAARAAGGPGGAAPHGDTKGTGASDDEVVDAEIVDDDKPEAGST
ncbi:hypothetical protein ACFVTY_05445 [Streptomyces sp. NPDC058067]